MDSDNNSYDGQPESAGASRNWLSIVNLMLVLIVLQILVAALSYPFLPEQVPSHWNWAGQVDGYMSRLGNALFWPGLSVIMVVFLKVLTGIRSSRLGSVENQQRLKKFLDKFLIALLLFLLIIQGTIIAFALGYKINILYVTNIVVAVFLIIVGNYLGKIPRNFWAGIRTPWTLASDVVWERTHRLGGWLFVLGGLVTIMLNLFVPLRSVALLAPLCVVVVITVIYSYVIYQKLDRDGQEPLLRSFHPDL